MEELSTHLRTVVTPQTQSDIQEALVLFDQYGVQDFDTAFMDLLMTADNHDPIGLTEAIVDLCKGYQDGILSNLLIIVADEASLGQGNTVLRVLKQLEDTELRYEAQVICRESLDPAEALCELIALITGEPVEGYYEVIDQVDPALIERIRESMQTTDPAEGVEPIDPADTTALLEKMKRFQAWSKKKPKVFDLLVMDMPLGLPFHEYYLALREPLENKPPLDVARELYAAALVASDTQSNPRTAILADLNATYTSADKITPIATALETLILQFQAAENAGVKKVPA